eukprot:TRINITY_DN1348_c0_g1_i2.p1 TRINITY_DN1348_c0_g1~~TRINITY_DN1348_c0_g1_i2.p1  ORF type:complete len:155 (+),score=30.41 TRINITY_DN1348_c0_g1_i2:555-1019(+)
MVKIGNSPIVMKKELRGFIQNRLQFAVLAEAFRLVEDDVISPGDVDTAVIHGLAARWSFMGPFQTIDLNAPKGVTDYCNRYLGGVYRVVEEQDNTRKFSEESIKKIDDYQRSLYSQEQIPQVTEWRDKRLMELAKHHNTCSSTVDKLLPYEKNN